MIMSAMRKGVIVAALHLAIVGSLGAKLLVDRATRPRVWARTAPVDPNLPIRGRYVRLRIEAEFPQGADLEDPRRALGQGVRLTTEGTRLVATPTPTPNDSGLRARLVDRGGQRIAVIDPPLAYFIPEHVPDPSRRQPGEELWVEVTLPRKGPPRPIRLGVKKDGELTPLYN